MFIQGNISGNKTQILADKYIELINKGVETSKILVIVLNSYKKADFLTKIYASKNELKEQKLKIYSFMGLCYNAFLDNWDYISKFIPEYSGEKPNLCGLEVSQYIFKESIKSADFSDYISKVNLLHQLFRRYSLIVQNCLTNEEVLNRSKIIGESFARDAQKAIDNYKIKTLKLKSFDYLRQLSVLSSIYENTNYFKDIKYFIADDTDEMSYAFWQFFETLLPGLDDYFIAFDNQGSSRCGYLCAYKSAGDEFIKKYSPSVLKLESSSPFYKLSDEFYFAVKSGKKVKTEGLFYKTYVKRLDMLQEVCKQIKELIKSGAAPEDIAVITPLQDEILVESFNSSSIKFQMLSGNEKLSDNKEIKHILILLKLINDIPVSDFEIKSLLIKLLKIPYQSCCSILNKYQTDKILIEADFTDERYDYLYKKLLSVVNAQKKIKNGIAAQIRIIYENLIKEFSDDFSMQKYNFLLKEAESFETAFSESIENIAQEFTAQIENSIISENPSDIAEITKGKIVAATPQKIIDYSYKTKYQLWLDISSAEWVKNDTGTLYNAWVLSRDWNKKEFTLEDNIALSNDKTARIVRKLMLCSQNKIMLYSSLYDNTGNENFGGISDFIENEQTIKSEFKIIPRDDQAPVLCYKKGKLGIMAVPGAGKTTILLALIIKMLQEGIKAENIFVLTYMESAAKNFKEKIKSAIPDASELPNISTIHGLALRIIKENGNYAQIGLDENFEICDDNTKENIIKTLFFNFKIDEDKYDNYLKSLSDVKLSCFKGELYSKFKEIQDFYKFYNTYNAYLKQNNLIDYDDMLCFAVKILEENPEIREYYQNLCKYVIEDEAQDSTDIQQKLISILSAKYNNLVRCGDVNQSITATFTNSNPEGFKEFIKANNKVEMTSSQRCAKPVYTLANKFIKEALKESNAFYDIEIKGTDKNPKSVQKPQYLIFDSENEEKEFILKKIKEIYRENPRASVAVLLRLNSQVNDYNEFFISNEIKTTIRTDTPSQKSIFKIIFSMLKIIQNPLNNINVCELAALYKQKGIYPFNSFDIDFIKQLKTPFINLNPDEIDSEGLLQLYFDIYYRLNNTFDSASILALNIGLYYSKNSVDKSNAYMAATLIKRLEANASSFEDLINKVEYAAKKTSGIYKFFDDNENAANSVSIMTMHKSKGDEFDYVFIPQLNEENYPALIQNVKLKSGSHFVQTIKNQTENTPLKTPAELKQEQVNETLRLLYVGITRAKNELYFTNALNYKRRKNTKPVEIVKFCINNLQ